MQLPLDLTDNQHIIAIKQYVCKEENEKRHTWLFTKAGQTSEHVTPIGAPADNTAITS